MEYTKPNGHIILPGFSPVVNNQMYARDESINTSYRDDIQGKGIILIDKYRPPSNEEVALYVQRKLHEVSRAALLKTFLQPEPIHTALLELDDLTRSALMIASAQEMVESADGDSELPKECIRIIYGRVTDQVYRININSELPLNPDWYQKVFEMREADLDGSGRVAEIHLGVTNGGLEPKRDVLEMVKCIAPTIYPLGDKAIKYYDTVSEIIETVYTGLDDLMKIALLQDRSKEALEEEALLAVVEIKDIDGGRMEGLN